MQVFGHFVSSVFSRPRICHLPTVSSLPKAMALVILPVAAVLVPAAGTTEATALHVPQHLEQILAAFCVKAPLLHMADITPAGLAACANAFQRYKAMTAEVLRGAQESYLTRNVRGCPVAWT